MSVEIAGFDFTHRQLDEADGLEFEHYWQAAVPAKGLTHWGRGDERLGDQPLPVAMLTVDENAPTTAQQQAAEWFCSHAEELAARVQAACEDAWQSTYYWEGNEMEDDEEFWVTGVRIPPTSTSEDVYIPRNPELPAVVIVDLEQDWEMEHAFYVVLDPANPSGDSWTTWDGLAGMGLVNEVED